ncbi:PorP/SprF family type IX secretion system membrane protein [Chryseobacterium sp. TY3]
MYKIFSAAFVLTLFNVNAIKAQETLPLYQQYLLDGDFLFNPALYGESDDVVLNLNYQKQFSNFGESPNVQSVGMHANVFDRVGVGASFFRDQNGPISANGITVGSAYFIPLGDEENRENQFSFGAGASFYNMNLDTALLTPENPNDPVLYDKSIFLAYANLGMAVKYKGFAGGVSVMDIALNNDIPIVNGIEPSPTKIILNAGYDWHFADGFFVTPSVLWNLNTNSSSMMDLNLLATVISDNASFSGGVSFRSAKSSIGSQNLALSPIIKGRVGNFTFGAVYNFGMSELQQTVGNSFMLSLGFRFENFINGKGFRYR